MASKDDISVGEMGYAAGILIGMQEKMINGNVSDEDIKQFEKAVETLKPFSPEELIEILTFSFEMMMKDGDKNDH